MRILVILIFVAISGCSIAPIQKGLQSKPGVNLTDTTSRSKYLESVTLSRQTKPENKDQLPLCVAQKVPNQKFTLKGENQARFNWFSGTYQPHQKMREVGAGNSKHYVSSDGRSIVTRGTVGYQSSGLLKLKHGVIYTLSIKPRGDRLQYLFTDLKQAQLDSGTVANDGFHKVGAWPAANPIAVYNELVKVVDSVNHCLFNNE